MATLAPTLHNFWIMKLSSILSKQSTFSHFKKHITITVHRFIDIHPILDGLFRGCSRMGGEKKAPFLKSVTHIRHNETSQSYTLPKEDPKNIWVTWHTPWALLTSVFFHQEWPNFSISRNTDTGFVLMHNFRFFQIILSL